MDSLQGYSYDRGLFVSVWGDWCRHWKNANFPGWNDGREWFLDCRYPKPKKQPKPKPKARYWSRSDTGPIMTPEQYERHQRKLFKLRSSKPVKDFKGRPPVKLVPHPDYPWLYWTR